MGKRRAKINSFSNNLLVLHEIYTCEWDLEGKNNERCKCNQLF